MQALDPQLDLDRFFHGLGRARERVLLLDYDGTLAPFHKRPERAVPYPRVAQVLREVSRPGAPRRGASSLLMRTADRSCPNAWCS